MSSLTVAFWVFGILGLGMLVIYLSHKPAPPKPAPQTHVERVNPKEGVCLAAHGCNTPSVAVTGDKTQLTLGEDKPAAVIPVAPVVVPEKGKEESKVRCQCEEKAAHRAGKRVTTYAPRRQYRRRYYRRRYDDGAWF